MIVSNSSDNSNDGGGGSTEKLHISQMPTIIIYLILSYFTGTTPSFEDVRKVSPEALQREHDSWCMKQKRESVKWLRAGREVCKLWREVASGLITGEEGRRGKGIELLSECKLTRNALRNQTLGNVRNDHLPVTQ